MSWTAPADVTGSWVGEGAPTDNALVQTWIDRAEREIRRRVPDVYDRLISGLEPDLLDTIRDVVVAMVTRVFRNPEGIRQWQESSGPFHRGGTYGGEAPGVLDLTSGELAALRGVGRRPGAFEIDLSPVPTVATWLTPDSWEPL